MYDNALVKGSAHIDDNACVFGDAVVCGDAHVGGAANVGPRARVKKTEHVVTYPDKEHKIKRVDPRTHSGPEVWTAYRTRKDGVRVLFGRKRQKLSAAPKELLKKITWAKV